MLLRGNVLAETQTITKSSEWLEWRGSDFAYRFGGSHETGVAFRRLVHEPEVLRRSPRSNTRGHIAQAMFLHRASRRHRRASLSRNTSGARVSSISFESTSHACCQQILPRSVERS